MRLIFSATCQLKKKGKMVKNKPLVTVCVATWNRADVLPKALASVLWQTYPNWECIVSDDGSTDNTKEVVMDFVKKDKRFIYINEGKSKYYTVNRNRAIKRGKGDLFAFRDDDGVWDKHFLEELIKPHSASDVLISYCGRLVYEGVNLPTLDLDDLDKLNPYPASLVPYTGDTSVLNGIFDVGDMVVKREPLLGVGGFREEKDHIGYCSDLKLVDDILKKYPNGRMVLVPKRLHHYFLKHGAKTKNMTIRKIEARKEKGKSNEEQGWKF